MTEVLCIGLKVIGGVVISIIGGYLILHGHQVAGGWTILGGVMIAGGGLDINMRGGDGD